MPIPPSAYSSNIASADGSQRAFVLPYGQINVASDGAALFTDTFDSTTIDTVFRWNAAVLAGSGTVTQLNGSLIITNGTTTSNAGVYYVTCTNAFGTTTSASVTVTVQSGIPEFNVTLPSGQGSWWDMDLLAKQVL